MTFATHPSIRVHQDRGVVFLTYEQPLPIWDWCATVDQLMARAEDKPLHVVSDRRNLPCAACVFDLRIAVEYVTDCRDALRGTRWAIVTRPDSADYGMARLASAMINTAGDPIELAVFTDTAEATAWVGMAADA
jgi:hypothetical protein